MVDRRHRVPGARWWLFVTVVVGAALMLSACAGSGGSAGAAGPAAVPARPAHSDPHRAPARRASSRSHPATVSLSCTAAPASLTDSIGSGLIAPATGLAGTRFVRAAVHGVAAVVAARLVGVPHRPVGTWWVSAPVNDPGTIEAVNGPARTWSNWGKLAAPGSPDAKVRARVAASAAHAAALRCAGPGRRHVAKAPASDPGHCYLRTTRDVIEWFKTPGQPAQAQLLGDVDFATCKHTYDLADLAKTSPTGPGFCTAVAFASDNRGYQIDAVPAAKPARVLAEVGDGC